MHCCTPDTPERPRRHSGQIEIKSPERYGHRCTDAAEFMETAWPAEGPVT